MVLLSVAGISRKEKTTIAVADISFTQEPLQRIAIAGETGSGKTTLLKMIAGLAQPDKGEILFEQKKVPGPNDQLIPGHPGIAYLSQHFELRSNYWVHEILSYANQLTQTDADSLYRICRIDHLLQRRTDQLSGGERQRVALARLLIGAPRLLLLDEPFSNLDAVHKQIIKSVIADINTKMGISCIMVSHDGPDTLSWADTILVMKHGRLVQQGTPEEIYRQPVSEYCAGLFGAYNLVNESVAALLLPDFVSPSPGKKLLLRPEQLLLHTGSHGIKSIVQQVLFMGSHYTTEVDTGLQLLTIRTGKHGFKPGASVQISTTEAVACWL
ncbi:MAG: ABC transporter ATP-binding protein [Chitinophagaceae bacterium]